MASKTWKEFMDTGLLWWANRALHIFGWAIVVAEDEQGNVVKVYPARVPFRGFTEEIEEEKFKALTKYMASEANELVKDTET